MKWIFKSFKKVSIENLTKSINFTIVNSVTRWNLISCIVAIDATKFWALSCLGWLKLLEDVQELSQLWAKTQMSDL